MGQQSIADTVKSADSVVDRAYSDPGAEVTFVWGEAEEKSPSPQVEEHAQTEIGATVAPSPYLTDKR